jgi:hypothetical protein
MTELGKNVSANFTRTGIINHDPAVCANMSVCYYLFSAAINGTTTSTQISFLVNHTVLSIRSIVLG